MNRWIVHSKTLPNDVAFTYIGDTPSQLSQK